MNGSQSLETAPQPGQSAPAASQPIVLEAVGLVKHYWVRSGWLRRRAVAALNGVSFGLERGHTLAVVGESGCGKSTLARQLTLAETPTAGRLVIEGEDVQGATAERIGQLRRRLQMVFQNPYASLNPRKTVLQTLSEPLAINGLARGSERAQRVAEMMRIVGLMPEHACRYPHMFSGGQRQRVAIARAMILGPQIVVADEPVSALDVSIQAQILNLFMDLQQRFQTSYVFISHNLSVVELMADEVMVMYLGGVVEMGPKSAVIGSPLHPYTQALLSATPTLGAAGKRPKVKLTGELPSPLDPPSGCAFHQRCPYAQEGCKRQAPELRELGGRQVACHLAQ